MILNIKRHKYYLGGDQDEDHVPRYQDSFPNGRHQKRLNFINSRQNGNPSHLTPDNTITSSRERGLDLKVKRLWESANHREMERDRLDSGNDNEMRDCGENEKCSRVTDQVGSVSAEVGNVPVEHARAASPSTSCLDSRQCRVSPMAVSGTQQMTDLASSGAKHIMNSLCTTSNPLMLQAALSNPIAAQLWFQSQLQQHIAAPQLMASCFRPVMTPGEQNFTRAQPPSHGSQSGQNGTARHSPLCGTTNSTDRSKIRFPAVRRYRC